MVLLFLSFQATSSNFRFVATPEGDNAICAFQTAFMVHHKDGSTTVGTFECPPNARPAAIVNSEHPAFIFVGFALSALGFFIQLLTVPSAESVAEIRAELKKAQLRDKIKQQ